MAYLDFANTDALVYSGWLYKNISVVKIWMNSEWKLDN